MKISHAIARSALCVTFLPFGKPAPAMRRSLETPRAERAFAAVIQRQAAAARRAAFQSKSGHAAPPATAIALKPYRAILVVDTWGDPASTIVTADDAFQPAAAILKARSVPFDIFRLDQQHLDTSYLLDRDDEPRYGLIIWLSNAASYQAQNLFALEQAVHSGTSFIAAHSRIADPHLERILGLKFQAEYTATEPLQIAHPHFITRDLKAMGMDSVDSEWDFTTRISVQPHGAEVLIAQKQHPVLTVNLAAPETYAIWMGVPDLASLRDSPYWRDLFLRAITWGLGYAVSPDIDYAHRLVLSFDDWGTADKSFLSYWHYQTPDEQRIREHLIQPLIERQAVIAANVNTGFVDRRSQRVISPWKQRFADSYGVFQDYASTQRGLKAGVAAGAVEIQSHGWTHMLPDLESPPGPWWTADLSGEASADGWYQEFGDARRGVEVPAIVQLAHLQRSREYLLEDFGAIPLALMPGGSGWSKSLTNHTGRVAALAGFGLFHAEPKFFYLDRERVLDMTGIGFELTGGYDRLLHAERWQPHPDGPVLLTVHDRDLSLQPNFVQRLFASFPQGLQTLSINQYIATLHTQINAVGAELPELTFHYDPYYCTFFASRTSSWRLWIADPLRQRLQALPNLSVLVDGAPAGKLMPAARAQEGILIRLPPGAGTHTWALALPPPSAH